MLCGLLCLTVGAPLVAADASADELPLTTLPGEPANQFTRIHQRGADRAFEKGNYQRAYRLYLKKLAPKGDKHAQYMIGHLHHHGLGVRRDLPRALAWYALAAERGSAGARMAAEQLTRELDEEERLRADEIVAELMERYGDRTLLVRAIQRDERELRRRTGSYVGNNTKPMNILTGNGTVTGDQYYGYIEDRIRFRLQLLGGTVTLGEFELIDTPEDGPEQGTEAGSEQAEEP
ncbi:MAG: hypothetical protein V2I57_13190 [Xanthomonadales bacterium]|jgi:hypothetical protein|nr:hypothetical protein [Xanthomonadales bacterium]